MAISNADIIDTLSTLLEGKGYRFHNGDAETGQTVNDETGADWWFTWGADRMSSYEVGETCTSMEAAYQDALQHFFRDADIPLHMDESEEEDGSMMQLHLLAECREVMARAIRFVEGFEDDELQEGIPKLLADMRKAMIGEASSAALEPTLSLLSEADEWLRQIRAENMDGSEPALGELLEKIMVHTGRADPAQSQQLSAELHAYCEAQKLPQMSADELVHDTTIPKTEEQMKWLVDFVARWDAAADAGVI